MFNIVFTNEIEIFTNLENAVKYGKECFEEFIKNNDNTFDEFLYIYTYSFNIIIKNMNHIDFDNKEEKIKYCNESIELLKKGSKDELYNFLESVADKVYSKYDCNGNLMRTVIDTGYIFGDNCILDKRSLYLKEISFKVGDIVRRIDNRKILYKVVGVPKCLPLESDNIFSYNDSIQITAAYNSSDINKLEECDVYEITPFSIIKNDYFIFNDTEPLKSISYAIEHDLEKCIDWINIFKSIDLTIDFIEKYKKYIDWNALSYSYDNIPDDILIKYADMINWDIYQAHYPNIPIDIANKFSDKINWEWYIKYNELKIVIPEQVVNLHSKDNIKEIDIKFGKD